MLPLHPHWPLPQKGYIVNTVDYSWNKCKTQTLRRCTEGNPKSTGNKKKDTIGIETLLPTVIANIKHSPSYNQFNKNPNIKDLSHLSDTIWLAFNKKL